MSQAIDALDQAPTNHAVPTYNYELALFHHIQAG
jgi:hypothetical protein